MLHLVDPATEDRKNKLRKVESFTEDFKKFCKKLYVPQKYVAIDEHMVNHPARITLIPVGTACLYQSTTIWIDDVLNYNRW